MAYKLTYEQWEQLGYPDIDKYVIDNPEDGFILDGYPDEDGNGRPDILDSIPGVDVILNPSHKTVGG